MAELGTLILEKEEDLKNFAISVRGFGQSAAIGDTIEVPADAKFGTRTVEINNRPSTYGIVKEVLYNGKPKSDQSVNFAIRGDDDRNEATKKKLEGCTNLFDLSKILPETKWKCIKIVDNPFGTKNATWELA